MKLYNLEEFLKLPAGVLYKKLYSNTIEIKGEWVSDTGQDWSCMTFGYFDVDDRHGDMEQGESYPINTEFYGRDGMFEADQMFLVYESWDLEQLKKIIEKAMSVAPEQKFKNPW